LTLLIFGALYCSSVNRNPLNWFCFAL